MNTENLVLDVNVKGRGQGYIDLDGSSMFSFNNHLSIQIKTSKEKGFNFALNISSLFNKDPTVISSVWLFKLD